MIALEVQINHDKKIIAGQENLDLITAHLTATGNLGFQSSDEEEPRAWLNLSGHILEKPDANPYWLQLEPVRIGDIIRIKISETNSADSPFLTSNELDEQYFQEVEKKMAARPFIRSQEKNAVIAIRLHINDQYQCTAGIDDLCVLSAHITAIGKLGKHSTHPRTKAPLLTASAGGLTNAKTHPTWLDEHNLSIGDTITLELIETSEPDSYLKLRERTPQKTQE